MSKDEREGREIAITSLVASLKALQVETMETKISMTAPISMSEL